MNIVLPNIDVCLCCPNGLYAIMRACFSQDLHPSSLIHAVSHVKNSDGRRAVLMIEGEE